MRHVGFLLLFLALSGCLSPLRTVWRFDAVGEYGSRSRPQKAVPNVQDVRVFYGNSPRGFSLKENELTVEPGYQHEILGVVTVRWVSGHCWNGVVTKDFVIKKLRQGAFVNGANAVIYATSRVSNRPTQRELCTPEGVAPDTYGSGWAVVVHDASPDTPSAAPPATPSVDRPN